MYSIFKGVKVLDITKVFSGPFATRMLADYGAEVIKIEHEKNYDDSRNYPPLKKNWSGYFEIVNRNKKGITLNLKDNKQLDQFYTLIRTSDIFVENLTPSTKHKLKIDYETVKKINPRLIYASLSGVGQKNDKKYYDVIAQAESGLMSLSGDPEKPMKIGPSVVDAFSGMTLAFALASALFYRQKTNIGQCIEVSMLACAMNLLESNLIEYSLTKKNPKRTGNHDTAISPFGLYKTKDAYIVVAAGNNSLWKKFADFLQKHISFDEKPFATNELRLKHNDSLTTIIENIFSNFSVHDLTSILSSLSIPCSRTYEMSDVYNDQNNYKTGALVQIKDTKLGTYVVPGTSITFSNGETIEISKAPAIGEDNDRYGL